MVAMKEARYRVFRGFMLSHVLGGGGASCDVVSLRLDREIVESNFQHFLIKKKRDQPCTCVGVCVCVMLRFTLLVGRAKVENRGGSFKTRCRR